MSCLHMTARLHAWPVAAILAVVVSHALPVMAIEPNDAMLGTWKITKVLDSSEISSIDDRQAARLVGKTLVIRPEKVTLAGESCEAPEFERHVEDTVRYLREEAHAASGKLGLPSTVTVVDLACTEALIKGHNKIVIYWNGFFFDAVKLQGADGNARKLRR